MNPRLFLLPLCLLSMGCMQAQLAQYTHDFERSKQQFADTIEIEYVREQVYVPVTINGQKYRFLLDTGAGQSVIFDNRPIDHCEPAGSIIAHDAIGRTDTVQMVKLPPITFGTLTLSGCQATVQHRPVARSYFDGIIGFDLVNSGLQMKIDVKNRQLILSDLKDFFDQEEGYETKYRLNYHVPYLKVSPFGDYTEEVLFDTGSRKLYSMNKQSFDKGEQKAKTSVLSQIEGRSMGRHAIGHYGVEPRGEVVFLSLENLIIGQFSLGDLHVITTQGGSHLGAKLLELGAVVFNPRRKRMRFQPYSGKRHTVVSNPQLEKAIINDNGRPMVGLVWEQSDAYQAGLREGDIILQAENHPIRSFAEYLAFRPLIGMVYTFTVLSTDGTKKEVKMRF